MISRYLLAIPIILEAFLFYEASGQIHCYSCSSNIGTIYGRRNYNCAYNLSAISTVRCSRGYYCLTYYTVQNGVISYLRRTCQNPLNDHNQVADDAPDQDGCISRHSSSSVIPDSTTCYFHCRTTRCNKQTPGSIKKCPAECPTSCDTFTGKCVAPLSCVQCTSDSDKGCERKTAATPCPRTSYNYCAATRTAVLTLNKKLVRTSVTKSCTTFASSYRIPTQPCKFVSTTSSKNSNYIKYTCFNFCSVDGCNVKAPSGPPPQTTRGLRCVVCTQTGIRGVGCTYLTRTTLCPPTATYCKSTVKYYTSATTYQYGRPIYRIALVRRECATEEVTKQCVTTNVLGTNIQYVSCQETCQTSACNSGWPARPKCSQCAVTNRTYSSRQFENCRVRPSIPRRCPTPQFQFCTTQSNNTASNPGYPRRVRRGCSITDIGTRCFDRPISGGRVINHCQSACNSTGCNRDAIQ